MIRLTWRQAKPAFVTCLAILLAVTAFAVYTEREMTSYIAANGLATCTGGRLVCGVLGDAFKTKFGFVLGVSQFFNFVPVLIGAFWAHPWWPGRSRAEHTAWSGPSRSAASAGSR